MAEDSCLDVFFFTRPKPHLGNCNLLPSLGLETEMPIVTFEVKKESNL